VIGRSKRFPTKKAMRNGENEPRGGYGTAFAYDDKHPRFTTEQSTEPSLSVYTNRKIAVHGFGAEDCSLVEVLEFNTRNEIGSLILNTAKLKTHVDDELTGQGKLIKVTNSMDYTSLLMAILWMAFNVVHGSEPANTRRAGVELGDWSSDWMMASSSIVYRQLLNLG